MKPEEQRIAIAESCGRVRRPDMFWYPKGKNYGSSGIPDYLSDLDAMHRAQKNLSHSQLFKYINELRSIKNLEYPEIATAAQRAEAYLKALGLWKD